MKRIIIFIALIGLAINANAQFEKYCSKIDKGADKFSNEVKYTSPLLKPILFLKTIDKDTVVYFMRMKTIGSTPPRGEGVDILFENGEVIHKDVETDVDVNSSAQYVHSAFFYLDEEDIELIKSHLITDFKLYIFEASVKKPEQYRGYMNCLVNMN